MKNIGSRISGSLAELVSKPGRQEKDSDVLMGVGVKVLKNGPNIGKMVGLFRGVSNSSAGTQVRNSMLGRQVATQQDIINVFKSCGMSEDQATRAMDNVRVIGKGFSAGDVKREVSQFETRETQFVGARSFLSSEPDKA